MTEGAGIASGLEGVVVAETELSHVDGQGGELWIRGHRVEALAGARSFEDGLSAAHQPGYAHPMGLHEVQGHPGVVVEVGVAAVAERQRRIRGVRWLAHDPRDPHGLPVRLPVHHIFQ